MALIPAVTFLFCFFFFKEIFKGLSSLLSTRCPSLSWGDCCSWLSLFSPPGGFSCGYFGFCVSWHAFLQDLVILSCVAPVESRHCCGLGVSKGPGARSLHLGVMMAWRWQNIKVRLGGKSLGQWVAALQRVQVALRGP